MPRARVTAGLLFSFASGLGGEPEVCMQASSVVLTHPEAS